MKELMENIFVADFAKLFISVICSAFIGWERERRDKAAGLKRHILIGFGACLVTIIGLKFTQGDDTGQLLRVFQGIITGVGFVGAGAIIHQGADVRGVTTAAGIWVIAAIGMTVGVGEYMLAFSSAVFIVLLLRLLYFLEDRIIRASTRDDTNSG